MFHVALPQKNRSLVFVSHLSVFPRFIRCYCDCCLPRTLTALDPDFCSLFLGFLARPEPLGILTVNDSYYSDYYVGLC